MDNPHKDPSAYHLFVTIYSSVQAAFSTPAGESAPNIALDLTKGEVIIRYRNFSQMRTREDAECVALTEIDQAQSVQECYGGPSSGIYHTFDLVQGTRRQ